MREISEEPRLKLEFRVVDGVTHVTFKGYCDEQTADVNKAIVETLIGRGLKAILADISDLTFTSRIGYLALDDCCMKMFHAGGRIILINPKPEVREEIEKMPFSRGCAMAESLHEALAMVRGEAAS